MINISKEELEKYKDYVMYDEGYRIVYYYEKYHEVVEGLYVKNVQDFANYLNFSTNISGNEILTEFLNCNTNALGVSIFNVNGKCVAKKIKDNVKKINNSEVYKEELIYDYAFVTAKDGYRIVYFYPDNTYKIGVYSSKLELFMTDFALVEPIEDESNIPKFISIDDLLNRYLNEIKDIEAVALYKVDGTLVAMKDREKLKK